MNFKQFHYISIMGFLQEEITGYQSDFG